MTNPWIEHVKKVKKQNPKLSLKQILKLAKKSYKKKKHRKFVHDFYTEEEEEGIADT